MRNFQRIVQIQFEDTMREVFKSSIEQCQEQIRFALAEVKESSKKGLQDDGDQEEELTKSDLVHMSRDAVLQTRFREAQCFQFDITIDYDKDTKEIKASPMAADWINAIPQHFEVSLKQLTQIKSFL